MRPYRGLAAYQPGDAEWFFGRERFLAGLVDRLTQRRFLALFGPSGSGKSSVLRAGLVPAALAGGLAGHVIVLTPGPRPLGELAVHLAKLAGVPAGAMRDDLAADPTHAALAVRQGLSGEGEPARLLLVVDQFEELFTLCRDAAERAALVTALLAVAREPSGRAHVVLGVRADFYARCAEHRDLADALTDAQVLIGPMTAVELRDAVTKPAERAGLMVEGALVSTVVADAAGQAGALPLVSHALLEAWRRRRGNAVTLDGYLAAGGVQGAIAQTAEQLYAELDDEQRQRVRGLLLRMVQVGDDGKVSRRRVDRHEFDGDDPGTGGLLDRLTAARLLTADDGSVEIAHEALLSAWPRLCGWLEEDREGLRIHRQITEAALAWAALDHDAGTLYRGLRLAIAREWAGSRRGELTPSERAFIEASTETEDRERAAAERRRRLLRNLTACLGVLLVAAVAVGVVALEQRSEAVRSHRAAVSRQLATQALIVAGSQPATGMLLSVEALRMAPTAEARSALISMSARQAYQSALDGHGNAVSEVAFSPDGHTLATVSQDQTVMLWDTRSRARIATLTEHRTWLRAVAFSPDGRLLATGGNDDSIVLWDVAGRSRVATLNGHTGDVTTVAFSPDGRTIASAGTDQKVLLWDVRQATQIGSLTGHSGQINAVAFSPDGRTLATASSDRQAMLWDVAGRVAVGVLAGHTKSVDAVAFSPDGDTLATASPDRTVVLWDLPRRAERFRLAGHSDQVRAVAFTPDGRTLASAGHDRTVMLWDTVHGVARASLTGHANNIYTLDVNARTGEIASAGENGAVILWDPARTPLTLADDPDLYPDVAFSPDGRIVATVSGSRVTLWHSRKRVPLAVFTDHTGHVDEVAFSPDGRTLATAGEDGTVMLWDVTNRVRKAVLTGHTAAVRSVAFSPDGRMLASTGLDQTVMLWDTASNLPMATLTGHTKPVDDVAFSPDGRTLATAGHDLTVMLWDVASRAHLATLTGHTGWLRSVAFSPDGRTLASASIDQTVIVWDVASRAATATLTGHTDSSNGVAFSPDGGTIAFVAADHTVVLWDRARHAMLARLTGHTKPVRSVSFSPDGATLASIGATMSRSCGTRGPTTSPCRSAAPSAEI